MNPNTAGKSGAGAASVLEHIAQQRETQPASHDGAAARRATQTILVVDDHEAMLYATCRTLEDAGFQTLRTTSGDEAIFLAQRASALVLDVNLPDTNGIAVLQAIRQAGATSRVPVVLTSAVFVDDIHRQVGLDSGADGYLVGPPDPHQLTAFLDQLLSN